MSIRNSAVRTPEAVEPTNANNGEVVKSVWQAPRVTRTDLSETANNANVGPDGGTFS